MEKGNTSFFIFFLLLILGCLILADFNGDFSFLGPQNHSLLPIVFVALVVIITFLFIYHEIESNKVLNQFITIVTHKFRTPLTSIRWTIDMLQKDLTLLEKKDLLIEMQKANERLMEIVDLMVSFAKFDKKLEYAFAAVSLREIIIFSLNKYSVMARGKNIKFSIESDKDLPLVIIDKDKIQFVVDMLIDNAIKYTPKDGSIKVSFDMDNKFITLKVADSGIGFNFFEGKKLFKHFFRSEKAKTMDTDGLGLGLYTAKKIVNHHNGKIRAVSPGLNKGSTFYLQLPIKR